MGFYWGIDIQMNHVQYVSEMEIALFKIGFKVKKTESNNLFTNTNNLHNHLRPSPLTANGLYKLKDNWHENWVGCLEKSLPCSNEHIT